jgi:hypothetical protein
MKRHRRVFGAGAAGSWLALALAFMRRRHASALQEVAFTGTGTMRTVCRSSLRAIVSCAALSVVVFAGACRNVQRIGSGASPDAEADLASAPDIATPVYPAFTPDLPKVGGSLVIASPHIVTITWSSDPNAPQLEKFTDLLGPSDYWKQTTSEYGVGAAVATHVHITDPAPASFTEATLRSWVGDHVANAATSGWPAADPRNIYLVFVTPKTTVTTDGMDDCKTKSGDYHWAAPVGSQNVAYAVIEECTSAFRSMVDGAAHELIESSTDAYSSSGSADISLGYDTIDNSSTNWNFLMAYQTELTDMCEADQNNYFDYDFSGTMFHVARSWSNAAAAAGHDPCVPAASDTYYNVTMLAPETVMANGVEFTGDSTPTPARGYNIPKGETKTFQIGLYSDGPTMGPWTIKAVEGNPLFGQYDPTLLTHYLTVALDKTMGQDGDIAQVTVTVNDVDPKSLTELITIVSQRGDGPTRYEPILITNN